MQIETTTDTIEQVKQAIGEIAKADGEVKSEGSDDKGVKKPDVKKDPGSGAVSETDEIKGKGKETSPSSGKDEIPVAVKATLGKLRQERRELRESVLRLQTEITDLKKPHVDPSAKKTVDPNKPRREDFANHDNPDEAWIEALTDYKAELVLDKTKKERDTDAATVEQEKVVKEYQERVVEAKERYDDFDAAFDELDPEDNIQITPVMQYMILNSEVGGDISYYLAKNPEVAEKIAKMSQADAIKHMGKLEQKVEDIVAGIVEAKKAKDKDPDEEPAEEGKKKEEIVSDKKITKAPKPSTPIRPSNNVTSTEKDTSRHVDLVVFDRKYEKERNEQRRNSAR